MTTRPMIVWVIFDLFSKTTARNLTKPDRNQEHTVLYKVCAFHADRKTKMAAPSSDWLRHFPLLIWNRLMEFKEMWQEARSQRPLPSLCVCVCVFFLGGGASKMAALTNLSTKVTKQKQKYRGMFETRKSRNKTSSGDIGLNIRTLASPKVGQDQVSGGVSVLCWHAAPVANVLWKPHN